MNRILFIILVLISSAGYSQAITDPIDEIKVSLYPNPAVNTLYLNVTQEKIKGENISVYNIIGNKLNVNVNTISEKRFSIDLSNLPSGYYLLVIENKNLQYSHTKKFLKK